MYSIDTTQVLEIEVTNYCNAFCGDCDRNIQGGQLNKDLNLQHMSLEIWRKIITKQNLKNIKEIHFDGNFGDAIMHPEFVGYLHLLADVKTDLIIKISTNGGARNTIFWEALAKVLNRFNYHYVQFTIDGLEDTNHIYRRGVVWKKLISNLQTFTQHGGFAQCRTIIFDHNKHQIEDIVKLAYNTGCKKFKSYRSRKQVTPVCEYKQFSKSVITAPSPEEFEKKYKVFYNWSPIVIPVLQEIESECPFAKERIVVIDPFGKVWPCCFIQGNQVTRHKPFPYDKYLSYNNIKLQSLQSILNFFHIDLSNAWKDSSYRICNTCLHKTNRPTQHNESI